MARSRIASARGAGSATVIPLRGGAAVPAAQTEGVQLCLLGPFSVRQGGRALRALPKKAQALLAYLAMQDRRTVPREQIAELLWGHSGGEQARRSLRQCLMSLRAALKDARDGALITEGDRVGLAPSHTLTVDAATFERLAASQSVQDLDAAQALYRDEFLSGLNIASEAFAEWLLIERRKLAALMSGVLYRLGANLVAKGEGEKAIAVAERLTAFDPLREDGHRLLMQALSSAGRRSEALAQFERCADLLRRELGVSPEPATAQLAEAMRSGNALQPSHKRTTSQGGGQAPAPGLARPDKPSIALLPFENLSGNPDQDYFANGIADELTIALGRIPWLFVIATSSTSRYRGHAPDAREVGTELGVRYVLRGSVRRSGQRLRVVVQLADATDGHHIWSDRFEGEVGDLFAIQDQVTAQVSGSIAPALQIAELDRARRKPTESLTAYDLYLRAVSHFRGSLAENHESVRLLRNAIEADPAYGAAYGFAARCYQFRRLFGWVALDDPQLGEGIRFGEIAAEVGLNDSEALWMAGLALAQMAGRVDHGRAMLDRSLVLNPSSANAWIASAQVHTYLGEVETAIEHFHRAHRLNPLDSSQHVGWNILSAAYFCAGDLEAAGRAADRALGAAPTYAPGLRVKIAICGMRGQDGSSFVARLLAVQPGASVAWLRRFCEPAMHRVPQLLTNYVEGSRRAGLPEG